jgi:hypothetical protein
MALSILPTNARRFNPQCEPGFFVAVSMRHALPYRPGYLNLRISGGRPLFIDPALHTIKRNGIARGGAGIFYVKGHST